MASAAAPGSAAPVEVRRKLLEGPAFVAGSSKGINTTKELGLKAFSLMATYATKLDPATAAAAANKLGDMLLSQPALSLFSDCLPHQPPLLEISPAHPAAAFCSSKKDAESGPQQPLQEGAGMWTCGSGKVHNWGVPFGAGHSVSVAAVHISFKDTCYPETLDVEYNNQSETASPEWKSALKTPITGKGAVTDTMTVIFPEPVQCRSIRLQLNGWPSENKASCFSIQRVRFFSPASSKTASSTGELLHQLETWLTHNVLQAAGPSSSGSLSLAAPQPISLSSAAAAAGAAGESKGKAALITSSLRGLLAMAQATGMQRSLVAAATCLLLGNIAPEPLPQGVQEAGKLLLSSLRSYTEQERARRCKAEYFSSSVSVGSSATAASWGPILDAAFDPSGSSSSGLEFSNGHKTVKASSSSNSYSALNVGPIKEGRLTWEMKLDEDTNSQCSCFGLITKPVTDSNYEYSSSMWMYRCYNGNRYSRGTTTYSGSGDSDKVFKGDTVAMELNMDEDDGILRMTIKRESGTVVEKGVVFKGLRGYEVWPAIAFYSSNRQISLLSVEGPPSLGGQAGGGAAAAAVAAVSSSTASKPSSMITNCPVDKRSSLFLADLQEVQAMTGQGDFGKHGDLGYGKDGPSRAVKVNKKAYAHALSLHPPSAPAPGTAGTGLDEDEEEEEEQQQKTSAEGGAAGSTSSPHSASDSSAAAAADIEREFQRLLSKSLPSSTATTPATAATDASATDGSAAAPNISSSSVPELLAAASAAGVDIPSLQAAARRAILLQRAQSESARRFKFTAWALYWLDGQYEGLRGAVSFNDTVTADMRQDLTASSPVFFELYGDSRLLWRSGAFHSAKQPAEAFDVPLCGISVLRLVTRCVKGFAGAHAVWLDPVLEEAGEWTILGFKNDRKALQCASSGVRKGGVPPLPSIQQLCALPSSDGEEASGAGGAAAAAAASAATSSLTAEQQLQYPHGLGQALLAHAELLSGEYQRGDQSPLPILDGATTCDLEAPYALDGSLPAFLQLGALLKSLTTEPAHGHHAERPTISTAVAAASCRSVVRMLAAGLRRLQVSGFSQVLAGTAVYKDSKSGKGKAGGAAAGSAGKKKEEEEKEGKELTMSPPMAALAVQLLGLSKWGGAAAGHQVTDKEPLAGATPSPAAAAAASAASATFQPRLPVILSEELQEPLWEVLDQLIPSRAERLERTLTLARGAGTLELELSWPCENFDSDGALNQLESVLLMLQLHANASGWPVKLVGRWPSRIHLLMAVPALPGMSQFLQNELQTALASVDLADSWSAGQLDLQVKLERSASWDRKARLALGTGGFGSLHLYPAAVASFEEVARSLEQYFSGLGAEA